MKIGRGKPDPTITTAFELARQGVYGRASEVVGALPRHEKLARGLIGVEELDDEELTQGVTRHPMTGQVRRTRAAVDQIPKELYPKMVAELYRRHDERLRGMLDECLSTMYEIATGSAYEAADRIKAATWIFERLRGKAPETLNISVAEAPWQRIFEGIDRQQRAAEPLDVEVVPETDAEPPLSGSQGDETPGDEPAPPDAPAEPAERHTDGEPGENVGVSDAIESAVERAERIKAKKDEIKRARNRRYAARDQGLTKAEDAQPITRKTRGGKTKTVEPEDISAPREKPRRYVD